jgi:hypothetical protein
MAVEKIDDSVIRADEYHPMADDAMRWFKNWRAANFSRYALVRESVASTALSGNRNAQICNGTLDRLEKGEPVSDRYLLGLCWMLRDMSDGFNEPVCICVEKSIHVSQHRADCPVTAANELMKKNK